jgi:hypothetical protein
MDGPPRPLTFGERIVHSLLFLFFAAVGLLGTLAILWGIWQKSAVYRWTPAECVVVASSVEEHPDAGKDIGAFRFAVSYGYTFRGERHLSARYAPGYRGSSDVATARRLAERYSPGAYVPCWVNPQVPSAATLARPSLWSAFLALLIPGVFLAVGGTGIVKSWRLPQDTYAEALPRLGNYVSRPAVIFFTLFLLIAAGLAWPLSIQPAARLLAARSWSAVPCTVKASRLRSEASRRNTSYLPDILYTYTVDGREHESNRYDLLGRSSADTDGKQAKIVQRYPVGSRTVCYVNPKDPDDAVLSKAWSTFHPARFLPLAMLLLGIGGMVKTLRGTWGDPDAPDPDVSP